MQAADMVSEIKSGAEYDGVCSLSSLLYLDPIDLAHSIHRLYHAIKPGGLLFLYAFDLDPSSRGEPYHVDLKHWMWSWTYGMDEAAQILEEFGYFKALKLQNVATEQEKAERLERWRISTQEQHDKMAKSNPHGPKIQLPDLSGGPDKLPYNYAIIARREM